MKKIQRLSFFATKPAYGTTTIAPLIAPVAFESTTGDPLIGVSLPVVGSTLRPTIALFPVQFVPDTPIVYRNFPDESARRIGPVVTPYAHCAVSFTKLREPVAPFTE